MLKKVLKVSCRYLMPFLSYRKNPAGGQYLPPPPAGRGLINIIKHPNGLLMPIYPPLPDSLWPVYAESPDAISSFLSTIRDFLQPTELFRSVRGPVNPQPPPADQEPMKRLWRSCGPHTTGSPLLDAPVLKNHSYVLESRTSKNSTQEFGEASVKSVIWSLISKEVKIFSSEWRR